MHRFRGYGEDRERENRKNRHFNPRRPEERGRGKHLILL